MHKILSQINCKTTLSLWVLVALLLFVPVAKYQHLSEHNLSEQSDGGLHNCKTCLSSIAQEFDNNSEELNVDAISLNTFLITFSFNAISKQTPSFFFSRAPPIIFH